MIRTTARPAAARASARRGAVAIVRAAALAGVLLLGGCSAASPQASTPEPTPTATVAPPRPTEAAAPGPLAVGQPPASVTIGAIALDEPLIDLGIQADGSMEVPADFADAGWFTGGGRPGGVGPTVIAGHVDSATGPAVFARLTDLVVGDTVRVTDVAGAPFDYVVTRVGDYSKADFPTTEVFGATPTDELRLITCTGLFDRAVGHYEDNRVVFASPI
ncbi:sortase domain-bontaining protein [Conyzicola sp.]|uniref:class F sortase n=1 Tax=Conyzicola sp. TaxID=1969404 RepID=UPI003989F7A1